MNLPSVLGGVAIGRDSSGNFRPSLKGVAVRVDKNRFVSLDNDQLRDITPFTFDNVGNVIYRVPVRNPEKGDLIITSDAPLRVLFVQEILANSHLRGLDPINGAVLEHAPVANILEVTIYVKVISLLDGLIEYSDRDNLVLLSLLTSLEDRSGSSDSNLLPLLLLQNRMRPSTDRDLLPLLLLRSAGAGAGGAVEALLVAGADGPSATHSIAG